MRLSSTSSRSVMGKCSVIAPGGARIGSVLPHALEKHVKDGESVTNFGSQL